MNPADRHALRALRDKYERMLALRTAHERARDDAAFVEPDPRREMATLADDYPGSLREIDVLPLHVITARIAALSVAELDATTAEPWMVAQSLFHRFARAALLTKRWLAGRKAITPAMRSAFAEAVLTLGEDATLLADDLDAIAAPPGGRLMDLVHAKVAHTLSITEMEARTLVFESRPGSASNRRPKR